jgi:hypothetical protein
MGDIIQKKWMHPEGIILFPSFALSIACSSHSYMREIEWSRVQNREGEKLNGHGLKTVKDVTEFKRKCCIVIL